MSEQQNPMGKIIAKALQDEAFKQQLIADPAGTLKVQGVAVPEGITLKVVEDTAEVRYLVLPAVSAGELTDVEIEAVAAGMLLPGWCRATPNPTISMGHGGAIS